MLNEIITNTINNIISSFDIPYCITVNIATYIFIQLINDIKRVKLTTWGKRIIFVIISIIVAIYYCNNGADNKIIFNSIVLAPVSWSWIFKPICSKLKIDYNNKSNNFKN